MNGTHVGNLEQTLPLFGRQVTLNDQFPLKLVDFPALGLAISAIFSMNLVVLDAYRRGPQIQLLSHSIHA